MKKPMIQLDIKECERIVRMLAERKSLKHCHERFDESEIQAIQEIQELAKDLVEQSTH